MVAQRSYPNHSSPVRAARMAARQKLPCPRCASDAEPMIRRARPLSAEWQEDSNAYFGCWRCGLRLANLSGPSAMRPSDMPLDHVPDPVGSLRLMLLDLTVA